MPLYIKSTDAELHVADDKIHVIFFMFSNFILSCIHINTYIHSTPPTPLTYSLLPGTCTNT